MPTLLEKERQGRVRRRSQQLLQGIRSSARRAISGRTEQRQGEDRLAALRKGNAEFVAPDVVRIAMYICIWMLTVAVYVLDYLLLAPVAEYVAGLGHQGRAAAIAPFAMPAAIILLESGLSVFRYAAYRNWMEGVSGAAGYVGWTALAVIVPLAAAGGVVALVGAKEGASWDLKISLPIIVMVAVLSVSLHLLVLCGGRTAMESKAWAVFNIKQSLAKSAVRSGETGYRRHSQAAADRFAAYLNDVNGNNGDTTATRIEPGPFDQNVRTVLNDVYGYEVIRLPDGTPTPPRQEPATQSQAGVPRGDATSPPAAGAGAEPTTARDPEWEALMARQLRDQESEIRN